MIMRGIVRLVVDERGQDLVEYALISGIVGIAGFLLIPAIADRMGTAYANWQSQAHAAWEPCPPGGC
jgi:Flp pilus assembly pilin Flp